MQPIGRFPAAPITGGPDASMHPGNDRRSGGDVRTPATIALSLPRSRSAHRPRHPHLRLWNCCLVA